MGLHPTRARPRRALRASDEHAQLTVLRWYTCTIYRWYKNAGLYRFTHVLVVWPSVSLGTCLSQWPSQSRRLAGWARVRPPGISEQMVSSITTTADGKVAGGVGGWQVCLAGLWVRQLAVVGEGRRRSRRHSGGLVGRNRCAAFLLHPFDHAGCFYAAAAADQCL